MYFALYDKQKILFFIKVYQYPGGPLNRNIVVFFEGNVFKEVRILYVMYPITV